MPAVRTGAGPFYPQTFAEDTVPGPRPHASGREEIQAGPAPGWWARQAGGGAGTKCCCGNKNHCNRRINGFRIF